MIILLLGIQPAARTQQDVTIENLIENIGEETYSSPELDIIEYYREYPMNLRYVSADELSKLPGISIITANKIINLVNDNPLIKNSIIADICGLSPEAEILLDNCTVNMEEQSEKVKKGMISRHRLNQRFEETKGIESNNYKGNSIDLYNRVIAYYDKIEICGIINKNSGEQNFNEYNSGYVRYDDARNKIIAGDFYADYGLGSLLWRQFSARKGSEVIAPILNQGSGISPYRSTLDFANFRGIAAQSVMNITNDISIRLSGFYSGRNKSSTIDSAAMEVTSLYTTGYYRTETEIEKKNNLSETALGGNFEFSAMSGFTLGGTILSLDYSLPINSSSSSAFSGKSGNLFSGYSLYKFKNNIIGSEISIDALSNKLLSAGFVHSTKSFEFAISARYIDKEFRSPFGYYFGEFSFPANEQGIYTGITYKPDKKLNISFYSDIYSSISRTYTVPGIVRGLDLFTEIRYIPESKTTYTIRLKYDSKTDLLTNLDTERLLAQGTKKSVRFDFNREISKSITARMRVEYANYSNDLNIENGEGILSFIDIRYKMNNQLRFGARYTVFSTDNFSSAIYQYEYNTPGVMQTTALYGDGGRVVFFAEFIPNEFIRLQANLTTTYKNNTDKLGSGNEQINSNFDTRGVVQLEFRLR
jgi:hypothetical protein